MVKRPPAWREKLTTELLKKTMGSADLQELVRRAQDKYAYWETFRHYTFPAGITAEEGWAFLKFSYRFPQEATPVRAKDGNYFGLTFTKVLYRRLSHIDTYGAGFIRTLTEKPTAAQREQLIMSGLSEEAIASSQIEGANTSRKVAKEMIYSGRKPRNKDEQMIINNYQVMQRLDDWKDLELSEEMLLDIQQRITRDTIDPTDAGRFRSDEDEIVVMDPYSGEVAFEPPKDKEMRAQLRRLIAYANAKDDTNDFTHPVIKATILHFWLAYLHPFVDGNGRTARALFYWYLLKRGYWLFQYLSVSRVIKTLRKLYDDAFLHTELDDNDLTYFVLYISDVTCRAIQQLLEHYEKKVQQAEEYKKVAQLHAGLNERQAALLSYFSRHPDEVTEIKRHQSKHGIVYQTARNDLLELVGKGLLTEMKQKNKKVFLPNMPRIKKALK